MVDDHSFCSPALRSRLDRILGWLDAWLKATALGLVVAVAADLRVDGYVYSYLIFPSFAVVVVGILACSTLIFLDHCRRCDDCGGWLPGRWRLPRKP